MLPFMKNKKEGSMSGPGEESEDLSLLGAVASDMMEAFEKKDKSLLKQALESFSEHLKSEDEIQDQEII